MNLWLVFLLVVISIVIAEIAGRPHSGQRVAGYAVVLCIVAAAALVTGCAADKETRITEYSGTAKPGLVGAPYVSGDLKVQGCRVVEGKGKTAGCITYKGPGGCTFTSTDCKETYTTGIVKP